MKKTRLAGGLFIILLLATSGCITFQQKKGSVSPGEFYYNTTFKTAKSVILLPVTLNYQDTKQFIFDTGAQINLIQRDSMIGKVSEWTGASKRKMELGFETTASLKIGSVEFQNTKSGNADMVGLKEQIENFGGLIGQPIISKANWLIHYPAREIEMSNKHLADDSFQSIKIIRKGGHPFVEVEVLGKKYKAIIDLGSTSVFSIPDDHPLANDVLNRYEFHDNGRSVYTLGGLQLIQEKVGQLPSVKIGNMEFSDIKTDIRTSSRLRIGMPFFKDYIIYIDNINGDYKIKSGASE